MKEWHSMQIKEVFKEIRSSEFGLSEEEASNRLKWHGPNQLKKIRTINPLFIFISQFNSFFIYLLLIAAAILAVSSHWFDFYVILGVVVLNAFIGFVQQYRAEKAIEEIRKLLVEKVKVLRSNKLRIIDGKEIVPGDVIQLEMGEKVIADARLFYVENVLVNEAILTGESIPIEKSISELRDHIELAERADMIYSGTTISSGSCKAVVVATGMHTEFGKISHLLEEIKPEKTPMQKKIDRFSRNLGAIIIGLIIIISAIGLIVGFDKKEIFTTAIALAVAVVPEGLPAVLAICLALATRRMAKRNVLIRKLPAAEALGNITVLCVDKTGTLTEEKMSVVKFYCNKTFYDKEREIVKKGNKIIELDNEPELHQLVKISVLCSNARFEEKEKTDGKIVKEYEIIGEPTEMALVETALDLGENKKELTEAEPRIKEFSFTSVRKMMSIVREFESKKISYVKGAPESIIKNASWEFLENRRIKLTVGRKKELLEIATEFEKDALRTIAFAFKYVDNADIKEKDAETGLIFVGFAGMLDPPREGVKEAIEFCKKNKIDVKMITGDATATALAIAKQIGLEGKFLTGKELNDMTDIQLRAVVREAAIFARTTPEHKLRIVNALRAKGEIVAVTGDGVNDILALKKSDIGIAMGIRGTDMARDVSEIVLLDDNFISIVRGVEEGKIVHSNTKKFISYLLGVNFAELLLIFQSVVARVALPLTAFQILWQNLITDTAPALALSAEREIEEKEQKNKRFLKPAKWLIAASLLAFISCALVFYLSLDLGIEKARTLTLTTLVIYETFFALSCRSNKPLTKIGFFSNKWMLLAIIFTIALQIFVIYSPISIFLQLTKLSIYDWLFILPFSLSGTIIFELWKIYRERK